jgi:hypothetical protein
MRVKSDRRGGRLGGRQFQKQIFKTHALEGVAKPITNNNLHVQRTPCTRQTNSYRYEQDVRLGVRRVLYTFSRGEASSEC